ncbi:hypothetical protein H206_06177 [Candidatus Electrothrix aarhusensis]|uniref:Uncharacterized protein n=1 Tax=Candidatus Electrothrix aarhusensis TaxID=1859131 RepID=A0A444J3V2_9BACT|nr:hypothetical protein H206_06177 [Candidatus Electrothrix aarhusensis]
MIRLNRAGTGTCPYRFLPVGANPCVRPFIPGRHRGPPLPSHV